MKGLLLLNNVLETYLEGGIVRLKMENLFIFDLLANIVEQRMNGYR